MNTLQNYDYTEQAESAEERAARLNRLKAAEIARRFAEIDRERIRPLAAIAAGAATDDDRDKLAWLEEQAQALRKELAEMEVK